MSALHFDTPFERRIVEPVPAVLTVSLVALILDESTLLSESALDVICIPVPILVPGLLACSVLTGVWNTDSDSVRQCSVPGIGSSPMMRR
ncbi:hypothetical protein SAMN05443661_10658 [Natronobacterium gregoryi]|uniref:Uncharacterized protein n=2 Tax=Natronobacterium gregoryi TaxID=44930 RepID=L0AEV0_NATGS|nr:hypothetical protein Natgr_0327 [Natronobacterium gregoryi SP2]ELY66640.1 hypothetical protein C490_12747 [Natronobacterium gregoryi SP2]PLK21352.1 hypothetical protein CYV19_04760 [Natronobacterium gregoryi SP2]SFI81152.1 hypothetical protein SAMN05443661_10658 [Natronobacterium gregoryi]